jgi:hypothetical protein
MLAVKFAMPNLELVDWQERHLTQEIINTRAVAPSTSQDGPHQHLS